MIYNAYVYNLISRIHTYICTHKYVHIYVPYSLFSSQQHSDYSLFINASPTNHQFFKCPVPFPEERIHVTCSE